MAEFLTTSDITSRLEKIIKNANDKLILISPYLKVDKRIKELLDDKHRDTRIDIRVIYGKNDLQPEENIWLESLTRIRTSFREHLHAKCYLNEDEALVTSMNLYEFSMRNNDEMGILVSREHDKKLYDAVLEEAHSIESRSQGVRLTVAIVDDNEPRSEPKRTRKRVPTTSRAVIEGSCIRCATSIPAKPMEPYCMRCYTSWNRFKNEEYEEQYCHTCGKEHKATMKRPVCLSCFRKYKNVLEFAAS